MLDILRYKGQLLKDGKFLECSVQCSAEIVRDGKTVQPAERSGRSKMGNLRPEGGEGLPVSHGRARGTPPDQATRTAVVTVWV